MSSGISAYQGGIPSLYTRQPPRQRGSGFLSGLKRFLLPLAKSALPHVLGGVADVVSGKGALETLKDRGRAVGADFAERAGGQAAELIRGAPPQKGIKRRAETSHRSKSSPRNKKKKKKTQARKSNRWS